MPKAPRRVVGNPVDSRFGRPRKSCDTCYSRKIKCIEITGSDQCEWCMDQELPCTVPPKGSRRRKSKTKAGSSTTPESVDTNPARASEDIQEEKSATVTVQEERRLPLSQLLNPPEPTSPDESPRQERLKNLFRYYGIPLFSTTAQDWIRSHCQPSNTLSNLSSLSLPWINRQDRPAFASQKSIPSDIEATTVYLPDRFITEACVALYKCGRTGLFYPLVDADASTNIIKTAYSSADKQQPDVITARAFVFSFVAFCSSAGHSEEMTYPVDGGTCALAARRLLHAVDNEPPSLEALQTTVFLVLYHCFEGCLWAVRGVLRIASHLVKDLAPGMGFFQPPSSDRSTIFRNLFWICFLIDKELFLRLGETPLLPAESCVPSDHGESPFRHLSRLLPCVPGVYTSTFHLSILMSKIYSELYAPEAVGKSDIAILRTIRALDDELEEWRLNIPKDIRPTIHASNQPANLQSDVDVLIMHLKFHNCLGCIHQAVSRCQSWSGEAGPVKEALRSSLNVSTQASAASLELMRANPLTLNRECFWLLCFYPLSALLNLFCKIVADTFDCESRLYLSIIKRIPEYFREVDTRHVTAIEKEHLHLMILFSTELLALAEQQVSES
ncbi:hypothetical protein BO94DRAFT_338246 [Aspergillus sclerotioniger CBS 115572]|uniref:Zn(2)-C6 fungal-type domain-containing protein n=1 Tax=Aspergillus sclerotioniger CBS 115572 TaxID=1450535 RepID=A0A317UW83_9EURO|nr:hypothetical protein BO94DRAFT_338246 [Aspergillus sclerotioniger CBS 115572]PWY65679.1 hypothetical protein BO94DRAFT_338246 [Aspergillus sclerotioniger CBS 115572]